MSKRLRYATIAPNSVGGSLKFGKAKVEVSFDELGVDDRRMVMRGDDIIGYRSIVVGGDTISTDGADCLNWLSVWVGEDVFPGRSFAGDQNPTLRGAIEFDIARVQKFLDHMEGWSRRNLTDKWRKACLKAAFGYFCGAHLAGLQMTPATEGIFATAIETVGNVWKFCPTTHRKFRQKYGPEEVFNDCPDGMLRQRLTADVALLICMRNVYGAHFGLHQERERQKLAQLLREWMERRGCSSEFAANSFSEDRLLDELQVNAHSLYKTALTLTRASFFAATEGWLHFTAAPRDFSW